MLPVHPGDMVPIIDKHLDEVPAVLSGSVDASGESDTDPGQPIVENVLQMSAGCGPVIYRSFRETLSQRFQPPIRDPVDILRHVGAVRYRIILRAVRPGVGVGAGGGHLLSPHLGCLGQHGIGFQSRNAGLPAELVCPVNNLLPDHRDVHFSLRSLLHRSHAGVRRIRVHLDAVLPVDVEAHLFPGIPQFHVVAAIDIVRLHLHLPAIHIDRLPGGHRRDPRRGRAAAQRRPQRHAGEQQPHILSSVVHRKLPLFSFGQ